MAIDKKTVKYVKDQLKAGYTPDQIKSALAGSGYAQADIDQAIAAAGVGTKAATGSSQPSGAGAAPAKPSAGIAGYAAEMSIGFIISLIAGIILIISAVLPLLGVTFFSDIFAFFTIILDLGADLGMIFGIVLAIVAIIGAVLIKMKPDNKAPGVIVLAVSIILILMGPAFFLGAIIGVIGGLLAVIGR